MVEEVPSPGREPGESGSTVVSPVLPAITCFPDWIARFSTERHGVAAPAPTTDRSMFLAMEFLRKCPEWGWLNTEAIKAPEIEIGGAVR